MNARRFNTRLAAHQLKKPVFACEKCRVKHEVPMRARCSKCGYTGQATIPGNKASKQCPNCAQFTLKNTMAKPLGCISCGHMEFIRFDSTAEYNYFCELANLQDRGFIKDLQLQVPFYLVKRAGLPPLNRKLVLDFTFHDVKNGIVGPKRYVDVKGSKDHVDPVAKLKVDIVEYMYGIEIELVQP